MTHTFLLSLQRSPGWSVHQLADVAYWDDLCDPSGKGTHLRVDWADGLVDDPDEIGWLLSHDEERALRAGGME